MFGIRTEAAAAKVSKIVDQAIAGLFDSYRPSDRLLSRTSRWFLAIILVLLALLSLPPLRNWLVCHAIDLPTGQEDRETAKAWCDFVFIAAQLAIIVVAGGVYFTDRVAEQARNRFNLYFAAKDQQLSDTDKTIRAQVEDYIEQLKKLPPQVTWWNAGYKLMTAEYYLYKIYRLLMSRLPRHIATLLAVRLVRSWSGGAAGFVIFLVFIPWVGAPIVKTYFDYPAVCG